MTSIGERQETRIRFLGQKDPLEKEMATHSSILAWRIPWTQEPGRLQFMGSQGSDMTERLNHHHYDVDLEQLSYTQKIVMS